MMSGVSILPWLPACGWRGHGGEQQLRETVVHVEAIQERMEKGAAARQILLGFRFLGPLSTKLVRSKRVSND